MQFLGSLTPIKEEVGSYLPRYEEIQQLILTYRKMYAA
jgi:hypothetical protein